MGVRLAWLFQDEDLDVPPPAPGVPAPLGLPAPPRDHRLCRWRRAPGALRSGLFHLGRRDEVRRAPLEPSLADLLGPLRAPRRGVRLYREARRQAGTAALPPASEYSRTVGPIPAVGRYVGSLDS